VGAAEKLSRIGVQWEMKESVRGNMSRNGWRERSFFFYLFGLVSGGGLTAGTRKWESRAFCQVLKYHHLRARGGKGRRVFQVSQTRDVCVSYTGNHPLRGGVRT